MRLIFYVALLGSILSVPAFAAGSCTNMTFSFSRKGDNLVASLNGGAESVQKAQARDIFFTPARR